LRALHDKSAASVAYALWNIFANFGFPKVLQSDNGTEFVNTVVEELATASHIDHRLITPYHPRANGAVERSFRTIMEMINTFCNGASTDWFESVPQVQLWLNLRATRSHGFTPFSIMFSRPFVGFKDFSKVPLDELSPEMLQKHYNAAFDFCYPAVDAAAKKVVNLHKLKFDKKRNCTV
jgi:transposase InsO family protein